MVLTGMLNEYRGDFLKRSTAVSAYISAFPHGQTRDRRFRFEDTDFRLLKEEKYDSPKLLELCQISSFYLRISVLYGEFRTLFQIIEEHVGISFY